MYPLDNKQLKIAIAVTTLSVIGLAACAGYGAYSCYEYYQQHAARASPEKRPPATDCLEEVCSTYVR